MKQFYQKIIYNCGLETSSRKLEISSFLIFKEPSVKGIRGLCAGLAKF